MTLGDAWEAEARAWIAWARSPDHDSYVRYHRDQFFVLLPTPGKCTVDLGCGEGRVARDLAARGHSIVAVDQSATMVAAARAAAPAMDVRHADATALPLDDSSADLVIAFMSLHDFDDLDAAIREIARVMTPDGRFCMALVHPLNSAGRFEERDARARFIITGDYLRPFRYAEAVERDGLAMTFHSVHRPLAAYFAAFENHGLVVEALREPAVPDTAIIDDASRRWQRLPLFLHMRARRARASCLRSRPSR
jgi:SAM-dependent methyltransferase